MAFIKVDDIVAYSDGEKDFCLDCVDVESTVGLTPILRDQIPEDEVLTCDEDECGKII